MAILTSLCWEENELSFLSTSQFQRNLNKKEKFAFLTPFCTELMKPYHSHNWLLVFSFILHFSIKITTLNIDVRRESDGYFTASSNFISPQDTQHKQTKETENCRLSQHCNYQFVIQLKNVKKFNLIENTIN